jgi:signal transduction histidine kinase
MKAMNAWLPETASSSSEVAEILPLAMMKFSRKGRVLFLNRASRELLADMQIEPEDLLGKLPRSTQGSLVRRAFREKRVELDWAQDGRKLRLVFLKASDVSAEAYLFMTDLTAQEETRARLIQSEKMASLGLLIAGLAHEINTPLGAIRSNNDTISRSVDRIGQLATGSPGLGAAERGRDELRLVDIMKDLCRNTALATDRLIALVGSLKNFARLDEADLKEADIHEGIDSTLTIVQHQLRNRIHVNKEYGRIPRVQCFPNRLNQVFINLLVNAAQAIPDRGVITIRTWRAGDHVKIAFSDTGVGIPPENIPRIFDPGFTTKGVGIGAGLGLSICYKIVEQHRGSIEVESSSEGSTFTITLPLAPSRKVKRG